ncbi:MAG: histidine kinase [Williamsia sp.]|nr:histidine kinase [Williamsia sp.]
MINRQYKDTGAGKKPDQNRINDNWFTLIGLSLSVFLAFGYDSRVHFPRTVTDALVLGCYITGHILTWVLIVYTVRKTRKKYPDALQYYKRFFVSSLFCLCIFFFINVGSISLVNWIEPNGQIILTAQTLGQSLAKMTISTWMIAGMYEALYQQFVLKETQQQKNELLRMQMQQKYDTLKGKVNPHFLFNSLNTLSSLIYTDTDKAEEFLEELSAVYRYLLKNNEDNLALLQEELGFIRSYITLVKIRFGEALSTEIAVDEQFMEYKLPAISLQVLMENAIKHNVVSKEAPLHVSICTEKGKLVVKNNLQRKPQMLPSEKMGLNYIISKYALVNVTGVEIEDKHAEFIVRLPLIKAAGTDEDDLPVASKNKVGMYD